MPVTIPSTLRVPAMYVAVDPSHAFAGAAAIKYRALLIGQRTSGTITTTRIDRLLKGYAAGYYGAGSMLDRMAQKWFEQNTSTELYAISLPDAAGVPATWTLTFTGPATAAGTLYLYIDGKRVVVPVAIDDTAAEVAAALVSALTADLPVTGAAGANPNEHIVTLTAKNDGTVMMTMEILFNFQSGEALPAGIACTVAAGTAGSVDPDIQDVLDVLGDEEFHVIVNPYVDDTNMDLLEAELASRWDYARQIPSVMAGAYKPVRTTADKAAALTDLSAYGNARNSYLVIMMQAYGILENNASIGAALGAVLAREIELDEVYPFSTLQLVGLHAPAAEKRFTMWENDTLLHDGMSTFTVDTAGAVRIQRAITMYQLDDAGAPDIAFLEANEPFQLLYLRYSWRAWMSKYARAKLMDDDSRVAAGQLILTPKIGACEAIAWAREMERLGKMENIDDFKTNLVVERNTQDPKRMDFLLPPDLVDQYMVGATILQFILQANPTE